MSDTRNNRLVYPDTEDFSRGYVEVHLMHNSHEAFRNIETAILLAKLGYQVRLLGIDTAFRTPDAYLIKEQIYIEFKHNQTPTTGAINNEIRDAQHQANYVLIHIQSTIRRSDLISAIKNRMRDAQKVKELWLIWKGELIRLKRKEIFDATISHKIQ
jgi:hypothetical protein